MNGATSQLSQLFVEACSNVENFALAEVEQETKKKRLYYHTASHVCGVKRRANTIFQAIKPTLVNKIEPQELERISYLISICAIAHDMVQEFSFSLIKNASRERPFGLSETATINKLIPRIKQINHKLSLDKSEQNIIFTESDINTITEAIQATVCHYDYLNNFIYQPYLYQSDKQFNLTAQIIALADLGTLGMEGIKPYLQEGILLFIEENIDITDLFLEQKNNRSQPNLLLTKLETLAVYPNLRERLLKYLRYLVKFAQGRKANFATEIAGFDRKAQEILRDRVFIHLTAANIYEIESLVPTAENTTLAELLNFFDFDYFLNS